jgi:hypothetical protein
VVPLRTFHGKYGERTIKYGAHDFNNYPQHVLESKKFPLWSGNDIRGVSGTGDPIFTYKHTPGHGVTAAYGVAYHLHNWFDDLETLRRKYATYGHADEKAWTIPLSDIEMDLDVMVKCVRNLPNNISTNHDSYYEHADGDVETFWKNFGGPRPLYFRNETYVRERHSEVRRMVADDERKHGSLYPLSSPSM